MSCLLRKRGGSKSSSVPVSGEGPETDFRARKKKEKLDIKTFVRVSVDIALNKFYFYTEIINITSYRINVSKVLLSDRNVTVMKKTLFTLLYFFKIFNSSVFLFFFFRLDMA